MQIQKGTLPFSVQIRFIYYILSNAFVHIRIPEKSIPHFIKGALLLVVGAAIAHINLAICMINAATGSRFKVIAIKHGRSGTYVH